MVTVPPLPRSFEEAAQRHAAVEAELERVCGSVHFRTSKRSCEFLRYVVRVTLDGRTDSLKERSIGIDLLGRDASYDPSSDATVRVRANEVRKRLVSYYGSAAAVGVRILLPTGSYVPQFSPAVAAPRINPLDPLAERSAAPADEASKKAAIPALSEIVLMRPALFALLICVLLLRHQLESRADYLRFWDHILAGRSAVLLTVAPESRDRLSSGLYPLVWIAGRYGVETSLNAPIAGSSPASFATVRISGASPAAWQGGNRLRWLLDSSGLNAANPSGAALAIHRTDTLTDRLASGQPLTSPVAHAALLTILPEDPSTLYAQATDEEALRTLFEDLTTRGRFPAGLLERLASEKPLQLLITVDALGRRTTRAWAEQNGLGPGQPGQGGIGQSGPGPARTEPSRAE